MPVFPGPAAPNIEFDTALGRKGLRRGRFLVAFACHRAPVHRSRRARTFSKLFPDRRWWFAGGFILPRKRGRNLERIGERDPREGLK
jgi:hypothetical protein